MEKFGNAESFVMKDGFKYWDWGDSDSAERIKELFTKQVCRTQNVGVFNDLVLKDWGLLCQHPEINTRPWYRGFDIVKDLSEMFTYLPEAELRRIFETIIWLIKEGVKNYGKVCVLNFGNFFAQDSDKKEPRIGPLGSKENPSYYDKNKKFYRRIGFAPAVNFKAITTPPSPAYVSYGLFADAQVRVPSMSKVSAITVLHYTRMHYKLSELLFSQEPFELGTFTWRGYSRDFEDYLSLNKIKLRKFVYYAEDRDYLKTMYSCYEKGAWKKYPSVNIFSE